MEDPAERSIRLPAEPASAAVARRFVASRLRLAGLVGVEDAAALCVSELVANVVAHTDCPDCTITCRSGSGEVTIEVADRAADQPVVGSMQPYEEHGRGLRIVDALADDWGVRLEPSAGKTVWLKLCDQ